MPDAPEPKRRSRGPATGHLWSGQAGPEAPPPMRETPEAPTRESTVFGRREDPEAPTAVIDRGPERRQRVWPRALAGGALSGLAVAAATLAIAGPLTDDDTEPAATSQPPAVANSNANRSGSSSSVGSIYEAASPAVASIQTNQGAGTGFLVSNEGTVVTNAHVVGSSSSVRVKFGDDGKTVRGRVVGTDTSTDLAVVRVDSGDIDGIRPLQWADSEQVEVGDLAVAVGNPLGLPQTATAGIVSGLQREIQAPNGFQIDEVIQTDAPINPGNSGGPLLDESARVIGVNSQIATSGAGSGNIGIGFAVPANTAKEVVPQLERGESIARPWIGVSTGQSLGGGAEVGEVTPGGPAQQSGVRVGDVITSIDGKEVTSPDDVAAAVGAKEPGDEIRVEVRRNGADEELRVRLGTRPR